MRPEVLVLDEPSAGLDAEARAELYGHLAELRRSDGLTLIFVSHDMAEVATLAEVVFVMDGGRLKLVGSPDDIFRHPSELMACGLLPPPLAEVTMLANQRGWTIDADRLTPEGVARVLAARCGPAPRRSDQS
jgi:energy-coupling factor transport system ATP-binding protein